MNQNRCFISVMLLNLIFCNGLTAQVFRLSNYLKTGEKDATLAVFNMLQDARKHKNSKVIIEQGTYHFYPEKAYEQYCYVTNHDNGLRRIAFPIIGFDGLTFIGNNSKLIFHGVMMPFTIEDSKNIDLSGFIIDWHLPLHSEGLIVANDSVNKSFDMKLAKNMPYSIRNEQLIFIKEGYEHDLDEAILFDPVRKAVAYRTEDYAPLGISNPVKIRNEEQLEFVNYVDLRSPEFSGQKIEYSIKATELEPGLVRISGNKKPVPPVGTVLVCKGQFGKNRIANAFHINKSSNVTLHHLTIHHAGGMGILGERSEDITLESVNIFADPDNKLMVSVTADASHFSSCKGKIVINNCNFRHQLDDATNIHGAFVLITDILGPDKVGVRIGHFQQSGFLFAQPGDHVGFINQEIASGSKFSTTVRSFNMLNKDYYIITFDEPVADRISKDYIIENLDWYPEVAITNSQFADNRARALLLKSPKKTIVKNNYFSTMMSAILIGSAVNKWWYESGGAQDVLIEGNTFGDCGYGGRGDALVMRIGGQPDRTLGRIIINNNKFTNFNPSILKSQWIRHLEFTNNTILKSDTYVPFDPLAYVLELSKIDTLVIKNIGITLSFMNKIKTETITTESIENIHTLNK